MPPKKTVGPGAAL
jgi:hypothetical protein